MSPNCVGIPPQAKPHEAGAKAMPTGLSKLATKITSAHEAFESAHRKCLERARECGQLLIEAKSQLKHGGWLAWLKATFSFSVRTAQYYIKVAERWDDLVGKNATVAYLTLKSAIDLLREPKPSEYMSAEEYTSERHQKFLRFCEWITTTDSTWGKRRTKPQQQRQHAEDLRRQADELRQKVVEAESTAARLERQMREQLTEEFDRREAEGALEHLGS
jgi:hypothetical protein